VARLRNEVDAVLFLRSHAPNDVRILGREILMYEKHYHP
jgi:hypothetical protein